MSDEKHYLSNGSDADRQTAGDAIEFARQAGAKMVDLKFTDLLGTWQHVSLPLSSFGEEASRGPRLRRLVDPRLEGHLESDMLLLQSTAALDPFTGVPTLSLICGVEDPLTRSRTSATRGSSPKRRGVPGQSGSPTPRTSARRPSSRLRRRLVRPDAEQGLVRGRLERGSLNSGIATGATRSARSTATSRAAPRQPQRGRTEMVLILERSGSCASTTITRSPPPAVQIDMRFDPDADGRPADDG